MMDVYDKYRTDPVPNIVAALGESPSDEDIDKAVSGAVREHVAVWGASLLTGDMPKGVSDRDRGLIERDWIRAVSAKLNDEVRAELAKPPEQRRRAVLAPESTPALKEKIRKGRLTARQIVELKPKPYLVKGFLDRGSLARVYGKPGSYKTFWTLDLQMSIARGVEWCGMRVHRAPVFSLVGEGAEGMSLRLRAYMRHHRLNTLPFIHMLPWAVPVNSAEWAALVEVLAEMRPRPGLITLDTQSRHMPGLDENTAKDMGLFIRGMEQLREATGACVLTVHHEGVHDGRPRGSTALTGALDHEFRIEKEGERLYVHNEKQKDHSASGGPLAFRAQQVRLGTDSDGDPLGSLVLVPDHAAPLPGRDVTRMRRAADAVATMDGPSLREILDAMPGDDKANRKAIRQLEIEGYVKVDRTTNRHAHIPLRTFDE